MGKKITPQELSYLIRRIEKLEGELGAIKRSKGATGRGPLRNTGLVTEAIVKEPDGILQARIVKVFEDAATKIDVAKYLIYSEAWSENTMIGVSLHDAEFEDNLMVQLDGEAVVALGKPQIDVDDPTDPPIKHGNWLAATNKGRVVKSLQSWFKSVGVALENQNGGDTGIRMRIRGTTPGVSYVKAVAQPEVGKCDIKVRFADSCGNLVGSEFWAKLGFVFPTESECNLTEGSDFSDV